MQVPRSLPPWLDGPRVRAEAKRLGVHEGVAREIMRAKAAEKEMTEGNKVMAKLKWRT